MIKSKNIKWAIAILVWIPLALLLATWLNNIEKETDRGAYTLSGCSQASDGSLELIPSSATTCNSTEKTVYGLPFTYKTVYTLTIPQRDFARSDVAMTVTRYATRKHAFLSWNFFALLILPTLVVGGFKAIRPKRLQGQL